MNQKSLSFAGASKPVFLMHYYSFAGALRPARGRVFLQTQRHPAIGADILVGDGLQENIPSPSRAYRVKIPLPKDKQIKWRVFFT